MARGSGRASNGRRSLSDAAQQATEARSRALSSPVQPQTSDKEQPARRHGLPDESSSSEASSSTLGSARSLLDRFPPPPSHRVSDQSTGQNLMQSGESGATLDAEATTEGPLTEVQSAYQAVKEALHYYPDAFDQAIKYALRLHAGVRFDAAADRLASLSEHRAAMLIMSRFMTFNDTLDEVERQISMRDATQHDTPPDEAWADVYHEARAAHQRADRLTEAAALHQLFDEEAKRQRKMVYPASSWKPRN